MRALVRRLLRWFGFGKDRPRLAPAVVDFSSIPYLVPEESKLTRFFEQLDPYPRTPEEAFMSPADDRLAARESFDDVLKWERERILGDLRAAPPTFIQIASPGDLFELVAESPTAYCDCGHPIEVSAIDAPCPVCFARPPFVDAAQAPPVVLTQHDPARVMGANPALPWLFPRS